MKDGLKDNARRNGAEIACIGWLVLLAVYLLHQSWRKWPDPMIDSGPQWYAVWRVSLGAVPGHGFTWYYGPLSLLFNGLLFRCFGPGMMVLALANLVIYAGIATLAYLAFRRAWGRLAALAALAVFISAFSFSLINAVGNYNYVLPYSNETTHGMLVLLLAAFVAARWCRQARRVDAFLLGLCGGVTAVLKPEFMLAAGVLGLAALALRYIQKHPLRLAEFVLLAAGVALPTLAVTGWFALREPWTNAWVDAGRAWLVFVNHSKAPLPGEADYMGYSHGWRNVFWELQMSFVAALVLGAIWAVGWFLNRPWRPAVRWAAALGAAYLAWAVDFGGGFEIGPCFPGLLLVVFVFILIRTARDLRRTGYVEPATLMALFLVLLAGTMLARMALRARINHFGFIQAALAGMVLAAFVVVRIPRWTGHGILGRRVARLGIFVLLAVRCAAVVIDSEKNHAAQTQPVATGVDRFYAFAAPSDETGALVNWCAARMNSVPPASTLLVLPEGVMINYLSRHVRPLPDFQGDENTYVKELDQTPPDYVILIWGDKRDGGIKHFGDPGNPGQKVAAWLKHHYDIADTFKGREQWAFLLRKRPLS